MWGAQSNMAFQKQWNEDCYLWICMAVENCDMVNTGTALVNVCVNTNMYMWRAAYNILKIRNISRIYDEAWHGSS